MAFVIFDERERQGLTQGDIDLLHQFILGEIQTSPEIRALIDQDPKPLVDSYKPIRDILRKRAEPLRARLKRATSP
jgi:hypothetical protein